MRSAQKYRVACFVGIGCFILLVFYHVFPQQISLLSDSADHSTQYTLWDSDPHDIISMSTVVPNNVNNLILSNNGSISSSLRDQFVQTSYIFEKFTMVTPTYRRTANIPILLDHYCTMTDIIHKIIILWNNVGEEVPKNIVNQGRSCGVPVVIKVMPKNNLTSRFIPYSEIETAGVLSIDDDLQLSFDSIHLAFETWKHYPYLLIGYTPRWYFRRGNRYKYHHNQYKGKYNMMMTNVAFIHRKYLELFTSTVPTVVKDYIIKTTNGEDITMNVVIGKYLTEQGYPQCVAMYVEATGLKEIGNLSKSGYRGLWKRKGHMKQRSQCLNVLNDAYGQLYLHECHEIVKHTPMDLLTLLH